MKVILSRKGFDSAFGGYPSPILPSGKIVSLPIPFYDAIRYSDLKLDGSTYYNLMADLRSTIKCEGRRLDLNEETRCHLDPDIHKNSINRESGWRPCFGQDGAAQSHLENQGVGEDDLFLFFGWFRKTRWHNGKLEFDPHEKGKHAIWGYLQIGEIMKVNNKFDIPKWLAYHPHVAEERRNVEPDKTKNTIYLARYNLCWNSSLPGAGRFMFNDKLVLTKEGFSRSKWNLPDCFKEAEISYHDEDSWKEGYFQSAAIGQEFVIKDKDQVEEWAKNLIEVSQIDY
jgi:hypothetical protein